MTDDEFIQKWSQPAASAPSSDDDEAFLKKWAPVAGAGAVMPAGLDESTGPMNPWEHAGRVASGYLASGLGSTIGLPNTLMQLAGSGINKFLPADKQVDPAIYGKAIGPNAADATKAFASLLPVSEEPRNNLERYGLLPVRAAPMIGATIASGGAALPALVGNLAGEAGGEAGGQLTGGSGWGSMLGGLAASLGVSGIASTAKNILDARSAVSGLKQSATALDAAKAAVADAKYNNPGMLADAKNGLKDAQDVADSQLAFAKQKHGEFRDNIVSQAETQAQTQQAAARQTIEQTADNLAPGIKDFQTAGEFTQPEVRKWLDSVFPAKQTAAWAPVDAKIAPDTPGTLEPLLDRLKSINSNAGELEPAAQLFKPKLPKDFQAALENTLESPTTTITGNPVTWKDQAKLRTIFGNALKDPMTVRDIGEQNARNIWGGLTDSMRITAKNAGAEAEFNAANAESQRLYDLAQGPMAKIVSGKNASLEHDPAAGKVAKSFLNSGKLGDTDLAAVNSELPQVTKAFAAAQLHENIDNPKAWNQLSDQAKAVLLPDSQARAQLENAIDAHTNAPAQAKATASAANSAYKTTIDNLQNETGIGLTAKQKEVRQLEQVTSADALTRQKANDEAQAKYDSAKAAIAPKSLISNLPTWAQGAVHGAQLGGLGALGGAALEAYQHGVSGVNPFLMLGLGAGGEVAYKTVKNIMSDSKLRQIPFGGLLGAETASEAQGTKK